MAAQRLQREPGLSPFPWVYLLAALVVAGAWTAWANARGLEPAGWFFTSALTVGPLALACEAARHLQAGRPRASAVLAGLLVGLLAYLASGHLLRSMLFPGDQTPVPPADALRARGLERAEYTSEDGVPLVGVAARAPAGKRRAAAVYFHGNAESAAQNQDVARALAAAGVDVLVAEFRGYGGRPGAPSEVGLLRDGQAAVAWAAQAFGVEPGDLVLIGRSLGTGVAAGLAGRGLGRRVALLSPYVSVRAMTARMVPGFLAWLCVRDPFDSAGALAGSSQPVLVIHGRLDGVIPVTQGEALAEGLGPARCRLVLLDNAGHNDLPVTGPRLIEELSGFAAQR
ncbi:MAG: alpha/beta hydrolase [Planctomycetota bacterium]